MDTSPTCLPDEQRTVGESMEIPCVATPVRRIMPGKLEIKAKLREKRELEAAATLSDIRAVIDSAAPVPAKTAPASPPYMTVLSENGFVTSPVVASLSDQIERMVADRVLELRQQDKKDEHVRRMEDAMIVKRTLEKKLELVRKQDLVTMKLAVEKRVAQIRKQDHGPGSVLSQLGQMVSAMNREDLLHQKVQNKKRRL